jgi:hypothetical protein
MSPCVLRSIEYHGINKVAVVNDQVIHADDELLIKNIVACLNVDTKATATTHEENIHTHYKYYSITLIKKNTKWQMI